MSEFDKWFEGEMPNSHKKVNKERIETIIYSCAEAAWDYQQAKIDDSENTRAVLYRENIDLRERNIDLQAKIDLLEVQLKGAEERSKLTLDHKNRMVDELQKENDRLNTWYKNVKLQLENKQIDCDRSDREADELQKKYDAMHNAFIVADDCRKEWHESYMSARKERDELRAMVGEAIQALEQSKPHMMRKYDAMQALSILKGNKDEK